jgi:hypothetical protein
MTKKILVIFLCAIFVIIILRVAIPTEEGRFKNDIKSFKKAVEQENVPEILRYISPEYRDGNGMVYETFRSVIENLITEFDSLNVSISGLKVFIDSTDQQGRLFAHCSLGLKLFARYQGERTLLYGGVVRPASVRAWFTKTAARYQVYDAIY